MKKAMEVVGAYYEAFGRKDLKTLRGLLAPDFKFRGAIMAFDGPDAFVEAMSRFPFEPRVEAPRFIADGDRVACTYLFKLDAPKAEIPMCEVFELAGGAIRSATLYFDSKLFPGPQA